MLNTMGSFFVIEGVLLLIPLILLGETVVQPKDRIFLCGAQADIKKAARILRRES